MMAWDINEALAYYKKQGAPGDQHALVNLLREIQSEHGGSIPQYVLSVTAQTYGIKESLLLAIIKRIPSLRLSDRHLLELCAGPNCGKHSDLAELAEKLCAASGGRVTLKYMPCMRMCGKGPNLRWDGVIHHKATVQLLRELIESAKKG